MTLSQYDIHIGDFVQIGAGAICPKCYKGGVGVVIGKNVKFKLKKQEFAFLLTVKFSDTESIRVYANNVKVVKRADEPDTENESDIDR